MRLKRLTLHGFKTFADRTEVEFVPGVTAVVGPNGSGKSNVADAITWVLGEQKASSLRASKAQDVIFAGSARRKPMGMAEVTLTVDNESRFLPLDFAEVTVTRRIYRSGESEYLLNKVPCRLRDIADLFTDTGVGRGAYAIVNQSEIDAILSARPEDRRELFEEAAGIKKYRVRKREAQRKLEHVETNLVRVRDIAHELGGQIDPLREQAETARRYEELSSRLREIEVGLLAAEYTRFTRELGELAQAVEEAGAEADLLRTQATDLEASASGLGSRIADAEAEMDRGRLLQQTALAQGERIEGQIALSAERRASADRAAQTLARDLQLLAEEKRRFEAEAAKQAEAAREAARQAENLARDLSSAEAVAIEADTALAELTRTAAGQQADYLELARRLAAQRAELDALRAQRTRRTAEMADLEAKAAARKTEADTIRQEARALAERRDAAQRALEEARHALAQEQEPARQTAEAALTALREKRAALERRWAEQGARLRALEETEAAQEGYFVGVRAVVRAAQAGQLSGRYLVVADTLRVPADLETAIEIALGASLQDIITDTEAQAKSAIAFLKETRGGRATFLPLDALRAPEVPDALRRAARQWSGVLGSAADLVSYDSDVADAVHVHLARILVVDDLDTATRIGKQVQGWAKMVTLAGEVVVPTGAITGGTAARVGPNLLHRKREIGELRAAVAAGRRESETLTADLTSTTAAVESAHAAVRAGETAVAEAREQVDGASRRVQAKEAEAERLAREALALSERVRNLAEAGNADKAREETLAAAVSTSGEADQGMAATREEMQRRQAALAVRRDEAQTRARRVGAELASVREQARSLVRDAERARETAQRAERAAEERTERAEEAAATIASEDAQAHSRQAERERAKAALAEAVTLFERWRDRRQALLAENFEINEKIKAAQRGVREAEERAQAARVRIARVETQAEAVALRLLEEYELHPDSAVALTGGTPPDRDTAQEIGRLRREIKALGSVNTGAIEEYERLSERWRFLTEQQIDLETARASLTRAITEIDDSTRGVFMETFTAVQAAFSRQFTRLFGGGTTDLEMTDPEDILETGIEIIAQPPGKKRQSLSLLSGGERALTAAALLFAFLEVKPAPFCVLDEVDAPLDGANVEKFADLLRDFGKEMQFIVITHNATTMEAAPLWYGITMQEPGISRGLSMKVPEPEAAVHLGDASPATEAMDSRLPVQPVPSAA